VNSAARRLSAITPSPTLAISAKAKNLQAAGIEVLNLSAGEPDFDTPEHIRAAAVAALARGETHYTATDGTAELKSAILSKLKRENGLEYALDEIIASSGAKQSLFNLCLALLNPGDEVLIPAPHWVSYPAMAHIAQAKPCIIDCPQRQGFKLDSGSLEAAITPKTRLLILNSPNNPSGACYTAEELAALGEVLRRHEKILIASDDIYEHLLYTNDTFVNIAMVVPELKPRCIIINGVSKAYAMTGWRLGYAAGPAWLIGAMKKIQSHSTSNPSSLSQAGALAALNGTQDCVAEMRTVFSRRRDHFISGLDRIKGLSCPPPAGAFYAFVDCSTAIAARDLENDVAFATWLLEDLRIAAVPGSAFGTANHIRFSYACAEPTLDATLERLGRALGRR